MTETIRFNFECKNCEKYQPAEKRKMGTCELTGKKVSKTFTCRKNPLHAKFLLYMVTGEYKVKE
jgi:hypothetical protein